MVPRGFLEYPRMLFRLDATGAEECCVVAGPDEKAAALAEGWHVRRLPWEPEPVDGPEPEAKPTGKKGRTPAAE